MSDEETRPPIVSVGKNVEGVGKMGSGSVDWRWVGKIKPELRSGIEEGFLNTDANPRLVVVKVENSEPSVLSSKNTIDEKKVMGTIIASEFLESGTFLFLYSGGKGAKPLVSKIRLSEEIYAGGQFTREQRQGGVVYFTEGGETTIAAPILGVEEISADEASGIDPKIESEIVKKTGVADKEMIFGDERITNEMLASLDDE